MTISYVPAVRVATSLPFCTKLRRVGLVAPSTTPALSWVAACDVTAWAAILAVTTAITGFYGQNVPYPGFGTHAGFYFSFALLLSSTGGLFVYFKRRHWI